MKLTIKFAKADGTLKEVHSDYTDRKLLAEVLTHSSPAALLVEMACTNRIIRNYYVSSLKQITNASSWFNIIECTFTRVGQ